MPAWINRAKIVHPKQNPKKPSSDAAPMSGIRIQRASSQPALNHVINAALENANPMAWAKRLGGPGTNFCHDVRCGALTCTANQPSGEIFGPVATRARKP